MLFGEHLAHTLNFRVNGAFKVSALGEHRRLAAAEVLFLLVAHSCDNVEKFSCFHFCFMCVSPQSIAPYNAPRMSLYSVMLETYGLVSASRMARLRSSWRRSDGTLFSYLYIFFRFVCRAAGRAAAQSVLCVAVADAQCIFVREVDAVSTTCLFRLHYLRR